MIDLKKQHKDFLALLTLLSFGLLAILYFRFDRQIQSAVVLVIGVCYVAWGIIHHFLQDDFHLKILVEYLAVALFGVILFLSLLRVV